MDATHGFMSGCWRPFARQARVLGAHRREIEAVRQAQASHTHVPAPSPWATVAGLGRKAESHGLARPLFRDAPRQDVELAAGSSFTTRPKPSWVGERGYATNTTPCARLGSERVLKRSRTLDCAPAKLRTRAPKRAGARGAIGSKLHTFFGGRSAPGGVHG